MRRNHKKLFVTKAHLHMYMSPLWIIQKTPLWQACYHGHLPAAKTLWQNGAYVGAYTKDNWKMSHIRGLNCLDAAVKGGSKYVCYPL